MDLLLMLGFGILGYLMRKFGYEPAPLILAFVLTPILENALQVTQSGQCIEIHSANQGGRLEITIDDQGPGIAPDMMETLFEPFSTSRITGTGLGLSIARSAIDSHRGEILVSNREGGGARFTILLPCLTEL
jgi:signal transduction histidine kinase